MTKANLIIKELEYECEKFKGTTIYELCKCDDGIYRIFPMVVKNVSPYGSCNFLDKKGIPVVWNLYAESDCTKGYYSFYTYGTMWFLSNEDAEEYKRENC